MTTTEIAVRLPFTYASVGLLVHAREARNRLGAAGQLLRTCNRPDFYPSFYRERCGDFALSEPSELFRSGSPVVPWLPPQVCERHATYDERVVHLYAEMSSKAVWARDAERYQASRVVHDAAVVAERRRQDEIARGERAVLVFGPPHGDPAFLAWAVTDEDRALVTDAPALLRWQNYRCAICAEFTSAFQLDHDHTTGLVRGWLCAPCNVREARAQGGTYQAYRTQNPAAAFDLEIPYARAKQRRKAGAA